MGRVFEIALAAAVIGFTASPGLAQVATVNGVALSPTQSTTVHFGGPAGTTATADLFLKLTNGNVGGNGIYNFEYTFTNTNTAVSNLVDFGFTTSPTLLGVSGSGMFFALNPNNFPGGYTVNVCAYTGNNCDAANGQADLFSGNFALTFAPNTNSISLGNFVDRYASLTQLNGISGEGTPVGAVPEPATWAMMMLGFGAMGASLRRGRRRSGRLLQIA